MNFFFNALEQKYKMHLIREGLLSPVTLHGLRLVDMGPSWAQTQFWALNLALGSHSVGPLSNSADGQILITLLALVFLSVKPVCGSAFLDPFQIQNTGWI